ncbi:MAG: DUF2914 domain-containing protein [Gemmatimonadaceae bacterium]
MVTMKMLGLVALGFIAVVPPIGRQAATVDVRIGKSIAQGMPVDTASAFAAGTTQVAGWTRVSGMAAGSKITHVWIHGSDSLKVELTVGGSPWRTYSRKTIPSGATGDWTLEVWSADGTKLGSKSFRIG